MAHYHAEHILLGIRHKIFAFYIDFNHFKEISKPTTKSNLRPRTWPSVPTQRTSVPCQGKGLKILAHLVIQVCKITSSRWVLMLSWQHMIYKPSKLGRTDLVFGL